MSDPSEQMPSPRAADPGGRGGAGFWSRGDLIAFGAAALISFTGYCCTLAPGVTLGDSGEFLTAARSLGVPHPPGYPLWTILAWIWQGLVPVGNIAWRINLMSAFFSALAVGLTTLLISRSGRAMLERAGFLQEAVAERVGNLIAPAGALAAGLLLAFCPVMWSQAVVAQIYGLNAFLLMATLVLLYRWSFETDRLWRLYLAGFFWGAGLTAQQTLLLLTVAFPAYIWFVDKKLGRDVLAPVLAVIIGGIICLMFTHHSPLRQGTFSMIVVGVVVLGSGAWLYILWGEGPGLMQRWPQVLLLYLVVLLGLAFYLYEPLASRTNPPMNWGYTQTLDGFFHHLIRGQYEKMHTERSTLQLWGQINILFDGLQQQFNIVYALLALVALFFYRDLAGSDRDWMRFLLVAFVFLGVGSIFLLNPTFERQSQVADRVFFLPAHCVYTIWIGYGLILGAGYLLGRKTGLETAALPVAIIVLLLPGYSIWRNWADSGQRDHNFGYQFGYHMFKPDGGYPEMDRDAVLFGGTDPGQFIASYMIFVESQAPASVKTRVPDCPESGTFDRRDVYIITQNALANASYLDAVRDHYGDGRPANDSGIERWLGRDQAYPRQTLWIPAEKDMDLAFQKYVEELRTRAPLPGEEVKVEHGHVSVQGMLSIMAINGYLARMVFDNNKDKHTFYVEEGYALSWMYPYAEPYGILLRLNKEPVAALDSAVVGRDRAYWDDLFHQLDADPKYRHDELAQKTFSKLRTADGELYAFRRMADEAEYAFQQAIALCPDNSEANFQLVQLYINLARFDDATAVLASYQKLDPYNPQIREVIKAVASLKTQAGQTKQLETQYRAEPDNLPVALELVAAYARARRMDALDSLVDTLSARAELSSNDLLQMAGYYAQLNRLDRVEQLLSVVTHRFPQDPAGWYNFALVHSARNECQAACDALEQAMALDGPEGKVREAIRGDARLNNCRSDSRFLRLLAQPAGQSPSTLPFTVSH